MELTQEYLKSIFEYRDGKLYWKIDRRYQKQGDLAGSPNNQGYCMIWVLGKLRKRSRMIFFMFNGYFPSQIDHINRNRLDDRIENLRKITFTGQRINDNPKGKIKHKHICMHGGKWFYVQIQYKGKRNYIGIRNTLEEAIELRDNWLMKHMPERLKYL